MISQRLRGVKEDGEAIEEAGFMPKLKEMFSDVGISIEDSNGELRSTYDILSDLAAVWDQLSSKQKQYFGEKVAGNRQVKTLNAIMQNWDIVTETINNAENASGAAIEGNEKYMDSIEGRITQLKSAMQELATVTINSDLLKGIVKFGTNIVKVTTNIGGLVPVLTTVIGLVTAINATKISAGIKAIGDAFKALLTGASGGLSVMTGWVGIITVLVGLFVAVANSINNANNSLKKFQEAKEDYEEHKNKIEELNTELEDTQKKIEELNSIENPTIVEQAELERLQKVNEQLERQIKLEEALARIAKGKATESAAEYMSKELNSRVTGDGIIKQDVSIPDYSMQYLGADRIKSMVSQYSTGLFGLGETMYYPTQLEEISVRLATLKEQYSQLLQVREDINASDPNNTALMEALFGKEGQIEEEIADNKQALADYYNWLSEQTQGLEYVEGAEPGSAQATVNEFIKLKDQIGDIIADTDMMDLPIEDRIDKILGKYPEKIRQIQEEIAQLGDDWKLDPSKFGDVIEDFEKEAGIKADELEEYLKDKFGNVGQGIEVKPQMTFSVDKVAESFFTSKESYKTLTSAISEQEKAGALSYATLQKLLSDEGLKGLDKYLQQTANGYRINTDTINEYIDAQNKEANIDAVAAIMERELAIQELQKAMQGLESEEERLAAQAQIDKYQSEIAGLQQLRAEADNATSALEKLRQASSSPNQDAEHSEAKGLLEKTGDAYKSGKIGTDDFKAGMDYLLGDNWRNNKDYGGDVDKAYRDFERKRDRYFGKDDYKNATNFAKDLSDKGFATYDEATGKIEMLKNEATGANFTLEEMAEAFGMSTDAIEQMFGLLNSYSLDDQFDFDKPITSAEELTAAIEKLNKVQKEREQAEKELAEAQESGDTSKIEEAQAKVDELKQKEEQLTSAIETANEAMEKGEFEPPQTLDDALKKLKEYEDAITKLNKNGITTPVELSGKYEAIVKLLEDPNATLTVTVSPETVDAEIAKIQAFIEEVKANPSLSQETKQKLIMMGGQWIAKLEQYKETSGELDGKTQETTFNINGKDEASDKVQSVQEGLDGVSKGADASITATNTDANSKADETQGKLDEINKGADATVSVEESETASATSVKSSIDGVFAAPTPAPIEAVVKGTEDAKKQIQSVADGPYEAEITITPKPLTPPEPDDGKRDNSIEPPSSPQPSRGELPPMPAPVKVDKGDVADQVQDAVEEGASNAEPTVTPEPETDKITEGIEEAAEGAEAKTEVDVGANTDNLKSDVEEAEENLPEGEAPIEANTSKIPDQIKGAVGNVEPQTVKVNVEKGEKDQLNVPDSVTETVNIVGKDAGASNAVQSVQTKAGEGATVPVDANADSAKSTLEKLIDKIKEKQTKPVDADTSAALSKAKSLDKELGKTVEKKVRVTYEETNKKPYAKGTKRAEEGVSLVDEKGAELIEHKKQGTYELGTNTGARLTHLDSGDIVHTAEETKRILAKAENISGFWGERIKSIKALFGNAFATGVGGSATIKKPKDKDTGSGSGSKKRGGSKDSSDSSEKSSNKDKDKLTKWTEWMKKFFDWAEIKLERLKERTEELVDASARAIGVWAKNNKLKEAMQSIGKEIEANTKAYKVYMDIAKKVADKANLSSDIVKKIQEGTIDVSQYDEVTRQQIKDYQEWYEKAIQCKKAIEDLKDEQKKLAQQRISNIIDDYDYNINKLEIKEDAERLKRELDVARGKEVKGTKLKKGKKTKDGQQQYVFTNDYGDYNEEIKSAKARASQIKKEQEDLRKELQVQIKEGTVKKGDDVWKKTMEKIEALDNEYLKALTVAEKLKDEANQITIDKINSQYENYNYKEDKKKKEMDLKKSKGSLSSKEEKNTYNQLISINDKENDNLRTQIALYKQLQKGLNKNSVEYEQLEEKIRSANDAILANEQETEEYKERLRQLGFDKMAEGLRQLTNEADIFSDSISTKMLKGIEITEAAYDDLIGNAKNQIANLENQIKAYEALMEELVAENGEDAKTSEKYLDYQKNVDALKDSIRGLDQSILQYEKDSKNIGAQKLGWQLEGLESNAKKAADDVELKKSRGEKITSDDYTKQIDIAKAQNAILQAQNEEYRRQQEGMDVNSAAWQELQQKISANEQTMRQLDQATVQWGKDIQNIEVQELNAELDNLNHEKEMIEKSMQYKRANGEGVTTGDYSRLIDSLNAQKLTNEKLIKAYKEQQKGMDVNSEAYIELQKSINSLTSGIKDLDIAMAEANKERNHWFEQLLDFSAFEYQVGAERASEDIETKKAKGEELSFSDYGAVRYNKLTQKYLLEYRRDAIKELQIGGDKTSDDYRENARLIAELESQIHDLELEADELFNMFENLQIEKEGWNLDKLRNEADVAEDSIEKNNALGKENTEDAYNNLIRNANNQITTLELQNWYYESLRRGMDENSEAYQDLTKKINANDKAVRDLNSSTIEWEKTIAEIKLNKVIWQLDDLNRELTAMSNMNELNAIQGIEETANQYKKLIDNGMERIKILKEENRLLEKQQRGMDKNTEEYQRLEQTIADNSNEILNIKKQQEEWNDSVIDIGIRNIQKYIDSLNKNNTQLERQKELQQAIQEIEKADSQRKVRTYVEGKGFVYQRDEDEYKKAQENLEKIVRDQLLGKLDDLIEALEESKKDINIYDKNGNLIGRSYNTPQLGNLDQLLSNYYKDNANAKIDIEALKGALGNNILPNVSNNNTTTFTIGDIIVNGAKDGNDLAQAIVNQFPNALLQALYKK